MASYVGIYRIGTLCLYFWLPLWIYGSCKMKIYKAVAVCPQQSKKADSSLSDLECLNRSASAFQSFFEGISVSCAEKRLYSSVVSSDAV